MRHHIQSVHEIDAPEPGTDYIIYTIYPEDEEESEQRLQQNAKQHSDNSGPSKSIPKGVNRSPTIFEICRDRKRMRDLRSSSSERSETQSETDKDETQTQSAPSQESDDCEKVFKCHFCDEGLGSTNTMKRHLERVHSLKDPKILKVIQKGHILVKNRNKNKYYLCVECNELCDQKFRHKYNRASNSHEPIWFEKPIITISDLPNFILDQAKTDENADNPTESRYLKRVKGFQKVDFNSLLTEYEQQMRRDINEGKQHDWKLSNVNGRIKRLREAIIATKGLQNAAKISQWLDSYPQMRAAATRRNNLQLLKVFLSEFLCPSMASNSNLVNFPVFIGQIDQLIRREQKGKKARQQVVKRATANMLPTIEEVKKLNNAVVAYLESKLKDEVQELDRKDFTLVIMNLVAMIIFRNASRSGTVTTIRTDYLDESNLIYSTAADRVAIQFAPKSVMSARKGPGERERLQKIVKLLEKSHKNFFCDGIRFQVVKTSELKLILKFKDVRTKMDKEHIFLFAPFDAKENHSYDYQKQFCSRFHASILIQHGFQNLLFNSTIYRKLITSEICERVSDPNDRERAHQHLGHWAETAQAHYNLERQKAENAAFTSLMIENLAEKDEEKTLKSTQGPSQELVDKKQAAIEYPWESDSNENNSENERPEEQQSGEEFDTDDNDGSEEDEQLTEKTVAQFLRTRKQRCSQQRYQLSNNDYDLCARMYFRFKSKRGNFSQLFRDSGLPMNLDALKSLFKVIDKHFQNPNEEQSS